MNLKNWMALPVAALIFSSCGQNSTKTTGENDTTINKQRKDLDNLPGTVSDSLNRNNVDNTAVVIPESTRKAFTSKYPNATNVDWRRYDHPYEDIDWTWAGWPNLDTSSYQVTYTDNGSEYSTWFDRNNNWVGTVSNLDAAGLPQKVNDIITKNYAGYTVSSVKRENDKNRTAYEVKLEKGDSKVKLLIDENGRILKK